jgi:hypothetical protein
MPVTPSASVNSMITILWRAKPLLPAIFHGLAGFDSCGMILSFPIMLFEGRANQWRRVTRAYMLAGKVK